jgi:hypothetical protein
MYCPVDETTAAVWLHCVILGPTVVVGLEYIKWDKNFKIKMHPYIVVDVVVVVDNGGAEKNRFIILIVCNGLI